MSPDPAPASARRSGAAQRFWDRLSDGLEVSELWNQFRSEATATYGFYSKEVDWEAIREKKGLKKGFAIVGAFFWSLVMKLPPARRVVLVIALAFLPLGDWTFRSGDATISVKFSFYGVLLILLLLALELADRVTMKRDLEIARDIQRWLVPEKPPAVPGCDIAFATRPANTVAGDYYDVVRRPTPGGERWLIVVADVAGKSVPAALLMATFQASLQTLSATASTLAELVAGLNRFSAAHSLGGMRFTTAFVAELDPAMRTLAYVNAGHNAPILHRAAGAIERLEAGGVPFGITSDSLYESAAVTLAPGDRLLIFTDGLVEAVNEQGTEFTDARLRDVVQTSPTESAAATQARIMAALDAFVGAARQHDDTTCLVLRVV